MSQKLGSNTCNSKPAKRYPLLFADVTAVPISSEETLPLRLQVLRPNKTIQDCIYADDNSEKTFHIGAKMDGKIIGVATFIEELYQNLPSTFPIRLRGMATHPEYQGQGIGRLVLDAGISEAAKRNANLIWCNAREIAFPFYEKLGFSYLGPLFDIPGIGPHKVMYKYL